jgi:hypothetical protein
VNVRDSDGTVILTLSAALTGGSRTTAERAEALAKPCLHVSLRADGAAAAEALRRFVDERGVAVLNVAGPRASGEPPRRRAPVRARLDRALGTR